MRCLLSSVGSANAFVPTLSQGTDSRVLGRGSSLVYYANLHGRFRVYWHGHGAICQLRNGCPIWTHRDRPCLIWVYPRISQNVPHYPGVTVKPTRQSAVYVVTADILRRLFIKQVWVHCTWRFIFGNKILPTCDDLRQWYRWIELASAHYLITERDGVWRDLEKKKNWPIAARSHICSVPFSLANC